MPVALGRIWNSPLPTSRETAAIPNPGTLADMRWESLYPGECSNRKANPGYQLHCSGEDSTTNAALWDWPLLTRGALFSTRLLLLENGEWHPQLFPSLLKLLGTANSGPFGDKDRVSTEKRKGKFSVLSNFCALLCLHQRIPVLTSQSPSWTQLSCGVLKSCPACKVWAAAQLRECFWN